MKENLRWLGRLHILVIRDCTVYILNIYRIFIIMNSLLHIRMSSLIKGFLTFHIFIIIHTSVNSPTCIKDWNMSKSFHTFLTLKELLANMNIIKEVRRLYWCLRSKEFPCNTVDRLKCRRHMFHPWVRKSSRRAKWQSTVLHDFFSNPFFLKNDILFLPTSFVLPLFF